MWSFQPLAADGIPDTRRRRTAWLRSRSSGHGRRSSGRACRGMREYGRRAMNCLCVMTARSIGLSVGFPVRTISRAPMWRTLARMPSSGSSRRSSNTTPSKLEKCGDAFPQLRLPRHDVAALRTTRKHLRRVECHYDRSAHSAIDDASRADSDDAAEDPAQIVEEKESMHQLRQAAH